MGNGAVAGLGSTPGAYASASAADAARAQRQRKAQAALTAALREHATEAPDFAVSVVDNRSRDRYSFGGAQSFESASIVKIDILAALLLQAQDEGRELTEEESALARRMIEISDNDATVALFARIGEVAGLTAANRRLGLRDTVVDVSWGLTRTTADDQTRLLTQFTANRSALDRSSRRLAMELMGSVTPDQRWGVSAAAEPAENTALKNGWLSRETEQGRWIVNSVGRITGDDLDVSIAVLSHGNPTMSDGIASVEKIAALARKHLGWRTAPAA